MYVYVHVVALQEQRSLKSFMINQRKKKIEVNSLRLFVF